MNPLSPFLAQLFRPALEGVAKAARKPLAAWMRKRATKLRKKQHEKDNHPAGPS